MTITIYCHMCKKDIGKSMSNCKHPYITKEGFTNKPFIIHNIFKVKEGVK